MEYYHSIQAYLYGEPYTIKAIRVDEAGNLPKMVINKQKQVLASNTSLRAANPEDILGVVNIKTCRLLKLAGKIWDQLGSEDVVWLISSKEWKDYSEKVLIHECKERHGKKLIIRNPAAMSPKQLFDMVDSHFPNIEKKFTDLAPQPLTPPPKSKSTSNSRTGRDKKPFLKAYAGSPHRPPKLTYSEKRKAAAAAGIVVDEPPEPFSLYKRSRSSSPTKRRTPVTSPDTHNGEHHLATASREQVNVPPLSPTLLRRVGLGRAREPTREIPSFRPEREHYENEGTEHTNSGDESGDEGGGGGNVGEIGDELTGEHADSGSPEHKSTNSYLSSDVDVGVGVDSPRSDRRLYHGHPLDGSVVDDTSFMLGTDDATLTTVTNSVAHSGIVSSLQDNSIAPTYTPYVFGTRFANGATPTVVDMLEDMLGQQDEPGAAADEDDALDEQGVQHYQDFLYEMDSVDDTVESVESASPSPSFGHSAARSPPLSPLLGASEKEAEAVIAAPGPTTPPPTVHSFTFGPTSEMVNVSESLPESPDFLAIISGQVEQQQQAHYDEESVGSDKLELGGGDADDGSSVSELSANTGNMTSMTATHRAAAAESPRSTLFPRVPAEAGRSVPAHSPVVVDFSLESGYTGHADGETVGNLSALISAVSQETSADAPGSAPRVAFEVTDDIMSASAEPADADLPVEITHGVDALGDKPDQLEQTATTVTATTVTAISTSTSLLGEVQAHYMEHLNQVLGDISTKYMDDLPPSPSRRSAETAAATTATATAPSVSTISTPQTPQPVPHAHFEDDASSEVDIKSHLSSEAANESSPQHQHPSLDYELLKDVAEVAATTLLIETMQHEIDESFSPCEELHPCEGSEHVKHGVIAAESIESPGEATVPVPVVLSAEAAMHSFTELALHSSSTAAEEGIESDSMSASEFLPAPAHPVVVDHAALAVIPPLPLQATEEVPIPKESFAVSPLDGELSAAVEVVAVGDLLTVVNRATELVDGADGTTCAEEGGGGGKKVEVDLASSEERLITPGHQQKKTLEESGTASSLSVEGEVSQVSLIGALAVQGNYSADVQQHSLEEESAPQQVAEKAVRLGGGPTEPAAKDISVGCLSEYTSEEAAEDKVDQPPCHSVVSQPALTVVESEDELTVPADKEEESQEGSTSSSQLEVLEIATTETGHHETISNVERGTILLSFKEVSQATPPEQFPAEVPTLLEVETPQSTPVESVLEGDGLLIDVHGDCVGGPLQMEQVWHDTSTYTLVAQSTDALQVELLASYDDLCFSTDHVQHEGQYQGQYQGQGKEQRTAPDTLLCGSLSGSLEMEHTEYSLVMEESSVPLAADNEDGFVPNKVLSTQAVNPTAEACERTMELIEEGNDATAPAEAVADAEVGTNTCSEDAVESHSVTPVIITAEAPLVLESIAIAPTRRCTESEDDKSSCSPLMPSSSLLITLSPDRELENSSLFIRNLPSDSAAASDASNNASDSEVANDSELIEQRDREGSFPDLSSLVSANGDGAQSHDESGADSVEEPNGEAPRPHSPPVSPSRSQQQQKKLQQLVPSQSDADPVDPATAAAAQEKALELQYTVQRQAEELAEANKAKAALEARLDETRQLLQLLVAGRAAAPIAAGSERPSSESLDNEIDLDALENTLKYVTVETVAGDLSDPGASAAAFASHRSGTPLSSSSKMRKSLRRLLEKKREEKSRSTAGGLDSLQFSNLSGEDGGGEEMEAVAASSQSLHHSRIARNRGVRNKAGKEDIDSSDSGLSSGSNFRRALNSGKSTPGKPARSANSLRTSTTSSSSFDSPHRPAGVPVPQHATGRKDLSGLHSRSDLSSAGIADRHASVDELEMQVTRLHSQGEDLLGVSASHSSSRDLESHTPLAVPVVSLNLELDLVMSSHSSDPHSADHASRGLVATDAWASMSAEEMQLYLPPNSPPPPPPPSSSSALPIPTSAVVYSVPQVLPSSAPTGPEEPSVTAAPAAAPESASQSALQQLQASLMESLPLNQHIISPRHLTVVVSSSSSSAADSDGEAKRDHTQLSRAGPNSSLASSQHSSAATFSPQNSTSSMTGRASAFSPRQIDHKSPATEIHKVDSLTQFGSVSYESHSDGESSVDSQNPLLLESTPKIRGTARRPVAPTGQPGGVHGLPMPLAGVPSGNDQQGDATSSALHSRFFRDESVIPPAAPATLPPTHSHATSADLLHKIDKADTPFLYNYDTYHALRPDLFLDSGPNSPFNPHSPFMHHPTEAALQLVVEQLQERAAGGAGGAGIAGSPQQHSADFDIIAATKANTAANAQLSAARISLTKTSSSALSKSTSVHPPSAEKVSFRLPDTSNRWELEDARGKELEVDWKEVGDDISDGEQEIPDEAAADVVVDRVSTLPPPAPAHQKPTKHQEVEAAAAAAKELLPVVQESVESAKMPSSVAESDFAAPAAVVPIITQTPVPTRTSAVIAEPSGAEVSPHRTEVLAISPPTPSSAPTLAAAPAPLSVSAPSVAEAADKLAPLFEYSLPLLATVRYMENGSLRGLAGRQELQRCTAPRDLLHWCVFQAYGTPEGAVVKGIKMIQVVRALKDAEICASITTSQLDLLLTKIHCAKAVSPVSPNIPSSLANQALIANSRVLRKTSASAGGAGSTAHHQSVHGGGNSSKGEQNSNSLAGASFPTFTALISAIAGILYSSDTKTRQRALKKGVTLGDLTACNNSSAEERESACCAMDRAWRRLLERRDHLEVHRMLLESQMSVSGLLLRTVYRRYGPGVPATGAPTSTGAGALSPGLVKTFSDADLEAVRLVWDRNSDQIRQIYGFYAASKEARRQGSGPSKLQISFESCREALVDFQVLPHVVDAQGFARLFKISKLWELQVAEQLLSAQEGGGISGGGSSCGGGTSTSGGGVFFTEVDGSDELNTSMGSAASLVPSQQGHGQGQGLSIRTDGHGLPKQQASSFSSATLSPGPGTPSAAADSMSVVRPSDDPHDFKGSVGNLCLSIWGFMELLTRVALGQQKLGVRPHEALENLMHIMDASDGKAKLIRASRKSTSVRHFVYCVK